MKMVVSGCDWRTLCVQSDVICGPIGARILDAGFFSPVANDSGPFAHE